MHLTLSFTSMCRDYPHSEISLTTQTIRIVLAYTPLRFQHLPLCKLVTEHVEIAVSHGGCIRQHPKPYPYSG